MSDPTENTPPSQPSNASVPPTPPPAYQAQPAPVYGAPAAPGQAAYGQQPGPGTFNVLSIVAFVSAFVVFPAAIICGHIALSQIKKTGEKGRGFAIAALVLGYLSLVAVVIAIVIMIIGFSMVAANPDLYNY